MPISAKPNNPPAIWAAFARQAQWQSWVLASQFLVIAFLLVAVVRLIDRPPDVVVISPSGESQYVQASVASEALARFLAHEKQRPSDVTVVHFTRRFIDLAVGINSATAEASWKDALGMMAPSLAEKHKAQAVEAKLIETYKAAGITSELQFSDIALVERTEELLHVRATVKRQVATMASAGVQKSDVVVVDVVQKIVPRTLERPDGLEVIEWHVKEVKREG